MLARLTSNASRKPTVKPVEEYKPVPIEKPDEDKENLDKPLPIPIERKRPGTSGTEYVRPFFKDILSVKADVEYK